MSKKWRIALVLSLIIMVGVLISACQSSTSHNSTSPVAASATTAASSNVSSNPGAFDCVHGSIIASGSTALQPYVEAVASSYSGKCPSAKITVQPDDSMTGLNDVQYAVSQIGISDMPALSNQIDLVDHQVVISIFVMIVNPDVKVSNITTGDLRAIYTGKISNWSQLGGANIPITIVGRPTTSGTRVTFDRFVLGGSDEHSPNTRKFTVSSTGILVQTIAQTRGAIGYASLSSAVNAGSHVSIVKIDNNEPSLDNVQKNSYKFWAIEHMYTKGQASGLIQAFLNYMLSDDASTIAKQLRFVKIKDIPQNVINAHA